MFSPYREAAESGSRPVPAPRARVAVADPRSTSGGPAAVVTEVLAALSSARVARGD